MLHSILLPLIERSMCILLLLWEHIASSQQEHTYSTLDQRKGQRSTESKAAAAAAQSNDIESSDSDDEPAAHTYLH